jgi:hypothetical protein
MNYFNHHAQERGKNWSSVFSNKHDLATYKKICVFILILILLGIYPSRLGPVQNIIGVSDITGNLRIFFLPQEHMTSDPKNVSLTTVGTLS